MACGPPAEGRPVPQIQEQIVDQDAVAAQVADVLVIMQLVFQQSCHT